MKKIKAFFIIVMMATFFVGCEDFVQNIDPLLSAVEDDRLNSEGQVQFLINGVLARFASTYDNMTVLADGLSDALFFDYNVPNATFPTFQEIDEGDIRLDNNSVDGVLNGLGEMRFLADDLVRRVTENISFTDEAKKKEALFYGYFIGGVARYMYATYIGLNPTEGGGVIDAGPFIPSNDMYDLAVEKLVSALDNAPTDWHARVVHTMLARIELFRGNYTAAANHAAQGLQEGDDPFQALYTIEVNNYWWVQAGIGRHQWVVDYRFKNYVDTDPAEAARIPLAPVTGNDGTTVYYIQVKYDRDTPLTLVSWQEAEMIQAEVEVRNGDAASALARVNKVRASHGLAPLASVDLDVIYTERDKEFFTLGLRLPDQRRFDRWHLPAGTWMYLPITQSERNANPNLPQVPQ